MARYTLFSVLVVNIFLLLGFSIADDPWVSYDFVVSYITASPLGVPQQVNILFLTSAFPLLVWIFHMGLSKIYFLAVGSL